MTQAHLYISGKVHGVGYRLFVKFHAQKLGMVGWVRNLPDGRVEAVIQGDKEKIEMLIEFCREGPSLAEAESVEVLWEEVDDISEEFSIK